MADKLRTSKSINSERFKVWMRQSKFDMEAARISMDAGFYEWSCYQSIQSVEKAFKAIIVHAGYRPPKVHKMGVLLGMANRANNAFANIHFKFRKIESYTFISRYPFVIPGQDKTPHELIGKDDAETCLKIASDICDKVQGFIAGQKDVISSEIKTEDYYFSGDDVRERLDKIVESIKVSDKIKVEQIILFGGFAREKTRPRTSTMDILVIGETDLSFIDRIQHVRELTKGGEPIIEPIVYTPQEFASMKEGEGFLESAIEEGKVLFPKDGSGSQ